MDLAKARALKRQFYLDHFYSFTKHGLGYKDLVPRIHQPMCRTLQDGTKRKLICVPRGTFKSSVASVSFPMWWLEKNPNDRVLLDSELFTNSKNFLREIKGQYETNQEFRSIFGDRVGPLWNESEVIISTRTKPRKEPSIACSGIGAGKTSQHYDLIIADDLSSYLNTSNPDVARKTIDHYRLYGSLLEPDGTLVVIGTRYSELDIIGFILENELEIPNQDIDVLRDLYAREPGQAG